MRDWIDDDFAKKLDSQRCHHKCLPIGWHLDLYWDRVAAAEDRDFPHSVDRRAIHWSACGCSFLQVERKAVLVLMGNGRGQLLDVCVSVEVSCAGLPSLTVGGWRTPSLAAS